MRVRKDPQKLKLDQHRRAVFGLLDWRGPGREKGTNAKWNGTDSCAGLTTHTTTSLVVGLHILRFHFFHVAMNRLFF